ncbi:MAG TPA: DUF3137 domain-containing protein [Pseudaminobacter sp.]|nr:DUF3137 domain-containing protein [Pseudaminobacter sp.]
MEARDFMPDEAMIAGIRADLETYEGERRAARRQVGWRAPVYLGLLAAVVAALAWGFNDFADPNEQWRSTPHLYLYVCALFAGMFAYWIATKPARDVQQTFREHLLPIVFGFIENFRYQHEGIPASFDRLPREAVGSFDIQRFDDVVSGKYEGFVFELYEAEFADKQGKSEQTKFKGVVLAFDTVTPFPGLLVATHKANMVTSFFRGLFGDGDLDEVTSGIRALDENYEFRTDNAAAAQPLVTGRLAQALQWLGEAWPDEPARVALHGGDGFLLLPAKKNFFELPPIVVPLDYRQHVEPIIADMAAMLATAALVRKVGASDDVEAA